MSAMTPVLAENTVQYKKQLKKSSLYCKLPANLCRLARPVLQQSACCFVPFYVIVIKKGTLQRDGSG
jgi:hypothetical protein